MLLESLVKATVELQGFRVVRVTGDVAGLAAELAPDGRYAPRCGQCEQRGRYRDTRRVRHFRHVPLWGIPVTLVYAPRRVVCARCRGVHVEALPWAVGQQRFTRALLVTIATWTRLLPWQQVATLFGCAWGTVERAVEAAVAYGLAHRDLTGVTHIGIDEISRKKGHVYVTNVYDLGRKRLLWSGEGRTQATLQAFFDFLGPDRTAALEGICCDMWQPYIDIIQARASQAVLVFDKFHIVRHLMAAVDQVRRDEIREKGPAHKALLHKTRFIWLKNPWNLTEAQHQRLGELERLNLKINRAYLLKELFAHFWSYRRAGWAKRYLKRWFWWATHSRLSPLRDFAWMLRRHQEDILNYFRMPINNGAVEGLNNKAKLIIHKAYGFRTAKNYIRNLYHCMADLPLPETMHTFLRGTKQQDKIGDLPKFIVSASVFVPNDVARKDRSAKQWKSDSWPAFPETRRQLLRTITDHGVQNVVFLSGDIHCSNVAEISFFKENTKTDLKAWSITSSAFYWPFPFADGDPLNYIHDSQTEKDPFDIGNGHVMHYKAWDFQQEDNFTQVTIEQGRKISVRTFDKRGKQLDQSELALAGGD